MRFQIRVGQEILAGNLALPPGAPVVEAQKQWIERFVRRSGRVIALKERVTIRELRLPRDVAELIGALQCPRVRVEGLAISFRRIFELERQVRRTREWRRVGAQVHDVQSVALGLDRRLGEPLHVGRAERRVLAGVEFVVGSPEPAAAVALFQFVLIEIEELGDVSARREAGDRGELERLTGVGPVAAPAAAF